MKRVSRARTILLAMVLSLISLPSCSRQTSRTLVSDHEGLPPDPVRRSRNLSATDAAAAPEFPRGLRWLNTDRPVTLEQLRGKIVLLDFWTYC